MKDKMGFADRLAARSVVAPSFAEAMKAPKGGFKVECLDKDGDLKWVDEFFNAVTDEGKDHLLDSYFGDTAYSAAWYMGLKSTGSFSSTDTLANHSGWTELTPYSGSRKSVPWGAASSGSISSSAISFSITSSANVAGAFNGTVSSGSSGTLYNGGDFSVARSVANGDTLNVTPTLSAS